MNSTLQIIIVILFILFLLKNFTNFEKERKDSFFNTHKELSNLNEESCDKLLEDNNTNEMTDPKKCCTYISAIKNTKSSIDNTQSILEKLEKDKDTAKQNKKNAIKCSKEERKLVNCINNKIRDNNKIDTNNQVAEIKAADFYKDYSNLEEKDKDSDIIKNLDKIQQIKDLTEECLTRNTYLSKEDNKSKCNNVFGQSIMDKNMIENQIVLYKNTKQESEQRLKDLECGHCYQCFDEPETNCVDKCSGVKPIQGSYNVLFLTETQQPPPDVLSKGPETKSRNTQINRKNLEERLAREEASRKAMNTEIYGERPPLSREEQVEKNKEFKQELKKQLEQEISNSLLTAKQTSDQTPFALIANTPNVNTYGENTAESNVLSYNSGDTHPNMKVNGKKLSHTYQVNQNQLKKVNQILGYDVDETDNQSLLKQSDKSESNLNHSSTNLGYQGIDYGNFPNDHQYNNIADLEGSLQNSSNNTLNPSSTKSVSKTSNAPNIHHHYYHNKQQQNPKIYYKTSKDSKLIPMITQENIDGVSNVFAPYIHLEIPPHFVPNQDI